MSNYNLKENHVILDLGISSDGWFEKIENTINEIKEGKNSRLQLQKGNGYIQYKFEDEIEWNNLISIDELKGEKGDVGLKGEKGDKGETGLKGDKGNEGLKGDIGITPNIEIGEVKFVDSINEASIRKTGTIENPVLNFNIPISNNNLNIWIGTLSEYNAIELKDPTTLYLIKEE